MKSSESRFTFLANFIFGSGDSISVSEYYLMAIIHW